MTLVVVNLPVKDVDDVAEDDLAIVTCTLLPTTDIDASTKSLSEVTEFVTVAYASVPPAAQTAVISSMCTLPSSLSIVTRDFAPLKEVLSNWMKFWFVVNDDSSPPSTLQSSSSTKSPVESNTVR